MVIKVSITVVSYIFWFFWFWFYFTAGIGFLRRPLAIVAAFFTALSIAFLNDRYAALLSVGVFSQRWLYVEVVYPIWCNWPLFWFTYYTWLITVKEVSAKNCREEFFWWEMDNLCCMNSSSLLSLIWLALNLLAQSGCYDHLINIMPHCLVYAI